ncbi:MAG TPA: hypothetical protein ENI65_04355 [Gammaproteobacteria bacterium]|nr:hypothetical protein [Gammaproteobacteria bacterium]
MMAENQFKQQIEAYDNWKNELIESIEAFSQWMSDQGLDEDNETALRIYEALEALKNDRLNLAFVAEFSRGKTELINAIFFSDYKRRLLPSEAGRTTMCPTELFYDRKTERSYLKLLPIETRLEDSSIQEYKEDPVQWTQIPLPIDSPDDMQKILQEIVQIKEVSIKKAIQLGLFRKEMHPNLAEDADPETTTIEIPKWRHALISFPHPLLQQGLAILDTPGLNALGCEPELTMSMIPAAQAILFILAADTGVTHSDLDIWQQHINKARRKDSRNVAVILNKIDTLWDELKSKAEIENTIHEQTLKTARMLGIDDNLIFPVSAHKGLLAKINEDELLLHRSQLDPLEKFLGEVVIPERGSILKDDIVDGIGSIISGHRDTLAIRMDTVNKQLNDLRKLNGKNVDVIVQLMKRTRMEQTEYSKHIDGFKSSSGLLIRQVRTLKTILNIPKMDEIIRETRKSMVGSWTTNGMKKAMKDLFSEVHEMTTRASEEVDILHRLVTAVYRKFHDTHGLNVEKPRAFKVKKYLVELDNLYIEAEKYRKSPKSTMSEQSTVVRKFFIQMVSQARNILFQSNDDLDKWLNNAMRPLAVRIKEKKNSIEKRLLTLRKINDSKGSVEGKLSELEAEHAELKIRQDELETIYSQLTGA